MNDYAGAGEFSDIGNIPDYGMKDSTNMFGKIGGGLGAVGGFLFSTNPMAGVLVTLAGGILGALTRRKPRRTAQEIYFDNMTNYYYRIGKRSRMATSISNAFSGKKEQPKYISGAAAINDFQFKGGEE